LMYGYLVKGERRLPRQDQAKDANLANFTAQHFLSLVPDEIDRPLSLAVSGDVGGSASTFTINQFFGALVTAAIERLSTANDQPNTPFSGELVNVNIGSLPENGVRSEEHTSELQSLAYLVCRLLLEKKK